MPILVVSKMVVSPALERDEISMKMWICCICADAGIQNIYIAKEAIKGGKCIGIKL